MSVHIAGLKALAPEGIDGYDTVVPLKRDANGKPQPPKMPYFVIEAPNFHERSRLLDGAQRDVDDAFVLRVVGEDIDQARWAAGTCRLAFDGATPDVPGWNPKVRLDATSPFISDDDVTLPSGGSPVFVADRYMYRATPAPLGS